MNKKSDDQSNEITIYDEDESNISAIFTQSDDENNEQNHMMKKTNKIR